jgi:ATP-dependent RNA helicase SUPV3L1/SUV3
LNSDPLILSGRGVTAVLGPTNTGKTHYAIERMVAHSSGIIGLPLRLLAREVYGRVADKVGVANVALITGEEKIAPPTARFSVCTVEAMPDETRAAFVAIDEVQLAGDLERGHVFTDRILNLRGREETLLLGAATMKPILTQILPGITVVERPRLSQLFYAGQKKITRLPHRSVIVAFSADEVYAIAELVKRQRGGAAVVLGALSPRTRNAQVALYQEGDVEYLVATDAIGMGLNLDVDHVAFAQDRKFDGFQYRNLNYGELGQIAGRAGRHLRDGTFGVTGHTAPFDDDMVRRIEGHEFDPVKVMQWRSKALDFSSITHLRQSLEMAPRVQGLTKALPSDDLQALEHLARYPDILELATTRERVEKLWEICALPDYRRITSLQHSDLVAALYKDIVRRGAVNEDFVAEQVRRADRTDGEMDTLSARIAQIRTWTYVSNRPGWLADPAHWQEKTRDIEDRLSDALHERLTKRFVDRRTSVLMRRLRENAMLEAEISVNGDVFVEGHHVGQLSGFRFTLASGAEGQDLKAVENAAGKALALEFEARAARLHAAGNNDLALSNDGLVRWLGEPVARLTASDHIMRPRIVLLADELLSGHAREHVQARVERFVNHHIATVLKPLDDLTRAEDLQGIAKGLAYQIAENLGVLFRRDVADDVKALDQEGRASMRKYGIRFGAYHVFMPALLKPAPAELITLLWSLKNDALAKPGYGDLIPALAAGRTSIVTDNAFERNFYRLAGFRFLGKRAVRIDILERLADLIRPLLQWKPGAPTRPDGAYDGRHFIATPAMLSILGATADDMEEILKGLGYRADSVTAEQAAAHLAATAPTPSAPAPATEAPVDAAAEDAAGEDKAAADEVVTAVVEEKAEEPATADAVAEPSAEAPAEEQSSAVADEEKAETVVAAEEPTAEAASDAQPVAEATVAAGEPAAESEPASEVSEATAPESAAAPEAAPQEEKRVLLWRPGGGKPENNQNRGAGPRRDHGNQNNRDGRRNDRQGEARTSEARPAGENRRNDNRSGDNRQGEHRGQPRERGENRRDGRPAEVRGEARPDNRPPRDNRPRHEERDQNQPRGPRPDKGGKPQQPQRFEAKPARKDKPIDPDSPFAKLAILKEQMKK